MPQDQEVTRASNEGGPVVAAVLEHPPAQVIAAAREAAVALQSVLDSKTDKVTMGGRPYLEFEDWQTLGRFYGYTVGALGKPEFVEIAGVQGFEATSVAIDRHGREISRATALCMMDEEKWSSRTKYAWGYVCQDGSFSVEDPGRDNIVWIDNPDKPGKRKPLKERREVGVEAVPLFQLASMAQTRANAKALRNVLSWVAVLAGAAPTPAEEMDGVKGFSREKVADAEEGDREDRNNGERQESRDERREEPRGRAPEPEKKPEPRPASNDRGVARGIVEKRRVVKEGTDQQGPYRLVAYTIKGNEYRTFNEETQERIAAAIDAGEEVVVEYSIRKKGNYTDRMIESVSVGAAA